MRHTKKILFKTLLPQHRIKGGLISRQTNFVSLGLATLFLSLTTPFCFQTNAQGYQNQRSNGNRTYTEPGEYDYQKPTPQPRRYGAESRPSYASPARQYNSVPSYANQNNDANRDSYYGIPEGQSSSNRDQEPNYSSNQPNYNQRPSEEYRPPRQNRAQDRDYGSDNPGRRPPNYGDNNTPQPPYRERQQSFEQPRLAQSYSEDEITRAGHRFFGNVTTGLAKIIAKAFRRNGRPNGYILGEEGGGAFIAGLRYGEGKLYTKSLGQRPIFWQGPSVGYDFGASGSKTMTLIYNLKNIDFIYQKFGGISGSAYAIGGIGLTLMKRDDVTLAPIRAGVGLRLGANIGYLKFTRRPTWNPF